ncbi:hypothetical protein E6R18_09500 [Streptomyces sp. A1277]|nr:hypothetical protein E6R18_09500 [Streptomyces sp. A1277]
MIKHRTTHLAKARGAPTTFGICSATYGPPLVMLGPRPGRPPAKAPPLPVGPRRRQVTMAHPGTWSRTDQYHDIKSRMCPDITAPTTTQELASAAQEPLTFDDERKRHTSNEELAEQVSTILRVDRERAEFIVAESERLYVNRMRERFSKLKVSERLKRTNPFLLRIRGAETVLDWATLQVQSALYASEEEAVGHLLESIIKTCFPGATEPALPDDFDFESIESSDVIHGYQVKMSWDCMPMSSRKNLSNTIVRVKEQYRSQGKSFVGYFAPCYGRAKTTKPPGQEYITLASKEFWRQVGDGEPDYDVRVGEVCALLCSEFRSEVLDTLVPNLLERLTHAAQPEIGDREGQIDYAKLFRRVNK